MHGQCIDVLSRDTLACVMLGLGIETITLGFEHDCFKHLAVTLAEGGLQRAVLLPGH